MHSGLKDLLEPVQHIGCLATHFADSGADAVLHPRHDSLQRLFGRSTSVGMNASPFRHQLFEELRSAVARLREGAEPGEIDLMKGT